MEQWKSALIFMVVLAFLMGTLIPKLIDFLMSGDLWMSAWYIIVIGVDCFAILLDYITIKRYVIGD